MLFGEDGRRRRRCRRRAGGRHVHDRARPPRASIGERLAPRDFVEAPVSGSKPKAEDGTLTIFAGGEPAAFERARPLFEAMGERIVHVGPLGHGQMAKLLTNTMGAVNAAVLAEAVRTAKAAGLDEDAFLEVAAGSAGASAMLNLKGRADVRGDASSRPCSSSSTCSRTCATRSTRRARSGIELQLAELAEDALRARRARRATRERGLRRRLHGGGRYYE